MKLQSLKLYDFRNYAAAGVQLYPGVNLIVGENAQGKTNLLEAIVYLSSARSPRTRTDRELLSFGQNKCVIRAEAFARSRDFLLEIFLSTGRRW